MTFGWTPIGRRVLDGLATRWGFGLTRVRASLGSHSHALGISHPVWIRTMVQVIHARQISH